LNCKNKFYVGLHISIPKPNIIPSPQNPGKMELVANIVSKDRLKVEILYIHNRDCVNYYHNLAQYDLCHAWCKISVNRSVLYFSESCVLSYNSDKSLTVKQMFWGTSANQNHCPLTFSVLECLQLFDDFFFSASHFFNHCRKEQHAGIISIQVLLYRTGVDLVDDSK